MSLCAFESHSLPFYRLHTAGEITGDRQLTPVHTWNVCTDVPCSGEGKTRCELHPCLNEIQPHKTEVRRVRCAMIRVFLRLDATYRRSLQVSPLPLREILMGA